MAIEIPKKHDERGDKQSLFGKLARRLFGYEREPDKPPFKVFTVRVGGETQVAELHTSTEDSKIDVSVLHPPLGEVAVVSRPGENNTSYLFQVVPQGDGVLWQCKRTFPKVKSDGFVTTLLPNPMDGFTMAIDAQSKDSEFFPDIMLPKGTEVLITKAAEIADIQKTVEASRTNPDVITAQQRYQKIIDAAISPER